jgi:6-phosphogluconate dehydrogenase
MVGGDKETFEYLKHLFESVAVARGVTFFPGVGAGHFVKMVHNGIEYGMMQAIAEGFTVLKNAPYRLDLSQIADIYNHGSVIESRLIIWLKEAFDIYGQDLSDIAGSVQHTGEGKWTVETAKDLNIKTKVIQEALQFRIDSEKDPSYTGKVLSALRNRFGGHSAR